MKYKEFEGFGVKVFNKGELIYTYYFDRLSHVLEFVRDRGSMGHTCEVYTCDEHCIEIQKLM